MSTNPEMFPDWWLGYLAATIKTALREPALAARARLTAALKRFEDSPVCGDELREALQAKPRAATASLNDGYTLERDYKPCGNPECRTPIPRTSRKQFCDAGCRRIAEQYAREQGFRERNPDYDVVPF